MKKTYIQTILIAVGLMFAGALVPTTAFGAPVTCGNGGDPNNNCSVTGGNNNSNSGGSGSTGTKTCGGVETSIIECGGKKNAKKIENTGLWNLLLVIINIMTAGVGVLALAGIIYGAVLYTSAGGNPEQVKKARGIFLNVAIGVIAFGAMYALLNFLVPGGVFN